MLPFASQFTVYVSAPGTDEVRLSTLMKLSSLYPIDGAREQSFLRGDRVLLRSELSDGDAQRIATSLRALGLRVDIEAKNASVDMVGLESFTRDEPLAAAASAPLNSLFDVGAGLMSLDGSDEGVSAPGGPSVSPGSTGSGLMGGLFGASLRDEDEPLSGGDRPAPPPPALAPSMASTELPRGVPPASAAPPPRKAPPPPPSVPRAAPPPPPSVPRAAPPRAAPGDGALELDTASRFRPTGADSGQIELKIDRVAPDPMVAVRPPEKEAFEAPRCPTHNVARINGRCPRCEAEEALLRSRLFGGKLRAQPGVRVATGLVAGLLIGWIATAPMARRAERQVEYIREEAKREHARPLEEAQAHAVQLDAQVDEEAQSAFFKTLGVWALITAAVTGLWFRLT